MLRLILPNMRLLLAGLSMALSGIGGTAADRPNVIVVMTDDQGYGDLSCHGNPVLKTPHLDRLHSESLRLTDYHVSPTCSPTRAALLTGHWTNRTGVWHTIMGRSMLRADEVTVGQMFQNAGYATGMFGKWHLGDNHPFRPEDRGFGEVMRHGGGGVGQTPDYWDNAYFDGSYWHNGTPTPVDGFCTDVFFDYAQRFMKSQKSSGKPFFAYIATNAPHGPMHSPKQDSQRYADQPEGLRNFYGMIANIDDNIGRLRTFLKAQDLADNTILIFTTDNGSAAGWKVFNAGMRAGKGSPFDGGHRVPFFLHWPERGWDQPRDITPITAHVDIVPTLLDLCGIAPPDDVAFDGRSLRPLLDGDAAIDDWPDRILVTDSQRVKDPIQWRQSSVMTSRWRLVNRDQLFDIKADPGQQTNVADAHPEVVQRLRSFYEQWWAELEPSFAKDARIHLGHPAENPARLTAHDWITTRLTPWNQRYIRQAMNGDGNTGYWNVEVTQPGEYTISLRRWPPEIDHPITAGLPAGEDVPGQKAYRAVPGQAIPVTSASVEIFDQTVTQEIPAKAREVAFQLTLPAGKTQLETSFTTADDVRYGAYYVHVERLE